MHGLGDVIMFYPSFLKLRSLHKGTTIDIALKDTNLHSGFSDYKEGFDYDYCVDIKFLIPQHGSFLTKVQLCCEMELGISAPYEICTTSFEKKPSPFVAMGFHSNCEPFKYGCPKDTSAVINKGILDAGKIPILLHFKSHSSVHEPYNYKDIVTMSTEGCAVSFDNLYGVLQHSFAYIGVNSGHMWAALGILGKDRCMCLEHARGEGELLIKDCSFKWVYQRDLTSSQITDWLKSL